MFVFEWYIWDWFNSVPEPNTDWEWVVSTSVLSGNLIWEIKKYLRVSSLKSSLLLLGWEHSHNVPPVILQWQDAALVVHTSIVTTSMTSKHLNTFIIQINFNHIFVHYYGYYQFLSPVCSACISMVNIECQVLLLGQCWSVSGPRCAGPVIMTRQWLVRWLIDTSTATILPILVISWHYTYIGTLLQMELSRPWIQIVEIICNFASVLWWFYAV